MSSDKTDVDKLFDKVINRLDQLVGKSETEDLPKIDTLGRLAMHLDDLKYREREHSGAMSPAHQKHSGRRRKK